MLPGFSLVSGIMGILNYLAFTFVVFISLQVCNMNVFLDIGVISQCPAFLLLKKGPVLLLSSPMSLNCLLFCVYLGFFISKMGMIMSALFNPLGWKSIE